MHRRLFGGTWLAVLAGLLLLSVALRQVPLLLVALVLLLTAAVSRLWDRACLSRVEHQRVFDRTRIFAGETVELRVRVVNRKLLPLAWLEVEDEFPDAVTLERGKLWYSHKPRRRLLTDLLSLRWYESVTRRYVLHCPHRGYFTFGPARLESGDIFGFFTSERTAPALDHLLVYPRILPLEQLGIPSKQPFGDITARQPIFEDPLRMIGVREYAHGDSLKRVHWKASARTQRLQVKLHEATTTLDLLLFLNVTTFQPEWQGTIPALLEQAVTVAASVASYGSEQGYRVGLYVNTNLPESDQQVKLPPSRDPEQLTRILEALAKVSGFATISMERFLLRESRNLPWGATIVLVSALASEGTLAGLLRLKKAGHRVALLLVGAEAPALKLGGIPVYQISGSAVGHAPAEPALV